MTNKQDVRMVKLSPDRVEQLQRMSAIYQRVIAPRVRVQVRRHTYRHREGFLVIKCDGSGCRIFSERESEAQRMAGELRRGEQPRFDFQLLS